MPVTEDGGFEVDDTPIVLPIKEELKKEQETDGRN